MSTERHTITLTLTVETSTDDYEGKLTPCERVDALVRCGTIRDALADVGLTFVGVFFDATNKVG